jgi:hypothetical protein
MSELEKSYKSEELKLKGRELAILGKKSETKLNFLKKKKSIACSMKRIKRSRSELGRN